MNWLQDLKNKLVLTRGQYHLLPSEINRLIEQAEKVEKLQEETAKDLIKCRGKLADIKIILNL